MILNDIHLYFLKNLNNLQRSNASIASRLKVTVDEVFKAREHVRKLQKAGDFVKELESSKYTGSLKDAVKTLESSSTSPDFQIDIIERKFNSKLKEQEDKYKVLLTQYEHLDESYNDSLRLLDYPTVTSIPKFPHYSSQACSVALFSDWHVGKLVDKKSVNGFNEYNPQIAKQRSERCTDSLIKLINRDSKDYSKHSTVIYLLGDFIEGYIHPESQMITNTMTPIEEVLFAQELLANSLNSILENAKTNEIKVICRNGNHGRSGKRMESSIDHRTSYETMLYAHLAKKFEGEIEFALPQGDIGYTDILGYTVRDFHGHTLKYGGGIGGLTVPLTKYIHRQNQNRHADFNVLGHFHQLSLPTKDSMMNSSLCGFDNYAQSIGAAKEKATQAYRLIDAEHGLLGFHPIICE